MFNNCTQSPTCSPCGRLVVISASFPSLLETPAHIPHVVGVSPLATAAALATALGKLYNGVCVSTPLTSCRLCVT